MRRFAPVLVSSVLALLVFVPSAMGAFGFNGLEVSFTEEDTSLAREAGFHPYAMTSTFKINTIESEPGKFIPEEETKDLTVQLPPGFAGDPTAVPQCSSHDFATVDKAISQPACPFSTAVGIAGLQVEFDPVGTPIIEAGFPYTYVPIYNLTPAPGYVARLGILILNVPVTIDIGVSQLPPNNVFAIVRNTSQVALVYGTQLTIWGNPADSVHDPYRGRCLDAVKSSGELISLGECPAGVPERPFVTLPRSCQGDLTSTFSANSWQDPTTVTGTAITAGMEDCGELDYFPEAEAQPTTEDAESPSGLDFSLDIDDEGLSEIGERAQSDTRAITVSLPEGMTVNPSAANGLGACSKSELEQASLTAQGCPDSSKLGEVEVTTPLLDETLEGTLYIAQPDDPATSATGAENPFDSLLAVYLVIRNPGLGILVKQAGEVQASSRGRVTTKFENLPEFPLSHVEVRFKEGPRAPLLTPRACDTHTIEVTLTPWSGNAPVTDSSSFTVDSGPGGSPCPPAVPPFQPSLEAGSFDNTGGAFSPFYMRLTRRDGEQEMTRFDSILPPGLTGKLAGVEVCSDGGLASAAAKSGRQELTQPSCPLGSQLGRLEAGAGVGDVLTYAAGRIYLAGPFGGAPLSAVAITPAVAGPFDLGTVVVREALDLDPTTAEVRVSGAAATPIPTLLEGVPLKLRDLRVFIDRPGFTLNPTSCEPKATKATLFGSAADPLSADDDSPVALSAFYQAKDCSALGFKPRLQLKLKGGTRRSAHPSLRTILTPRPGDANIGRAVVTLPPTQFIDAQRINNPCTRVQFNAGQCPKTSILGTAKAVTPLLDKPLEGPVYFRSNGGERELPDIVADLHGQFHIVLVGFVDSKRGGGIRTTFQTIPDAPVSRFTLSLKGGKQGILVNSSNLCARKQRANLTFIGQNNRRLISRPVVKTDCKARKKKRAQKRAR